MYATFAKSEKTRNTKEINPPSKFLPGLAAPGASIQPVNLDPFRVSGSFTSGCHSCRVAKLPVDIDFPENDSITIEAEDCVHLGKSHNLAEPKTKPNGGINVVLATQRILPVNDEGKRITVNPNIIVLGASAGGVEALSRVVGQLPESIPAAFLVTLHLSPFAESNLPKILERAGNLPAKHPEDLEPVRKGIIYVAPPDFHLILQEDGIRLGRGPKENRHRPSIDVMFRSASKAYGPRVAGVLLTGNLDDGVAGLLDIKERGGLTLVQDPREAHFPEMPMRALEALKVDWCLSLVEISQKLVELATQPEYRRRPKRKRKAETPNPPPQVNGMEGKPGKSISLTCPECQGPLWEFRFGELTNYRCLVGHRYNLESLLAAHSEEVEQALWVALRTLEERVALQRQLSKSARSRNNSIAAACFSARASKNAEQAKLLRKVLEERSS
jgi:two-component system chemotaxis response regulator CheB